MTRLSRRYVLAPACLLLLLAVLALAVCADEPKLTLRLRRDFGYGGFSGEIEGSFTLTATGPPDVARVVFLMDGQPVAEALQAPFQYRFQTGQFPPGTHSIQAVGFAATGSELQSNVVGARFLTSAEAKQGISGLILPLLGIIFGLMFLSYVVTYLLSRRAGASGKGRRGYGVSGGAICPRCKRPFACALFGLPLIGSQLERCPHCGKWAFVQRASPEALAAAESAQAAVGASGPSLRIRNEDDQFQRELEDSRYQDS